MRLARRHHRRAVGRVVRRVERTGPRFVPIQELRKVRPVRWDITIGPGWKGAQVKRLQRHLNASTYPAGEVDGVFGEATVQGLLAFEKATGATRDGQVDPKEMGEILTSRPPPAPEGAGDHYIDIDITRQVLFEVTGGRVINTYPISSANGATYESSGGSLAVARTPRGSFRVERKIPGWRTSYLGQLYYPVYFLGGYAIHGSPSVPAYPASHGCIRIPMHVAEGFYSRTATGVPITVHD